MDVKKKLNRVVSKKLDIRKDIHEYVQFWFLLEEAAKKIFS